MESRHCMIASRAIGCLRYDAGAAKKVQRPRGLNRADGIFHRAGQARLKLSRRGLDRDGDSLRVSQRNTANAPGIAAPN